MHTPHRQQPASSGPHLLLCFPTDRYICKALAGRLPPEPCVRRRFVDPSALLLGQRSSVLVAPLGPHGSLQDLLNAYLAQRQASTGVAVGWVGGAAGGA